MTAQQVEAIYKDNLGLGHRDALRAVFTQGYCLGAGVANSQIDLSFTVAQPATTVKIRHAQRVPDV